MAEEMNEMLIKQDSWREKKSGGWVDGLKAVLRITYSNKKCNKMFAVR